LGQARSPVTPRTPRTLRTPRTPRKRRAVGVSASRAGRSAEIALARRRRRLQATRGEERRVERRWQRQVRFSEELAEGGRLKQRWCGAKMDAKAVVLQQLKSGRNSDKLANALSLLTSLE
jgi:hypothetical protein